METPKLVELTCDTLEAGEMPEDPENCFLDFVAVIGTDGLIGDSFRFYVATPKAFAESRYTGWSKDHIILQVFSWALVENYVNSLLESISGGSWEEIALQLHEFMHWEFYNYKPA